MERKLNGIDEIMGYCKLSALDLIRLKRDFGFPIANEGGIYCIEITALNKWLKLWNVLDPLKISYSDCEKLYLRRLEAKRPGEVITGDINAVCIKLKVSPATLMGLLSNEDCPVRRIPGTNQFRVNTKNWRDYYDLIYR